MKTATFSSPFFGEEGENHLARCRFVSWEDWKHFCRINNAAYSELLAEEMSFLARLRPAVCYQDDFLRRVRNFNLRFAPFFFFPRSGVVACPQIELAQRICSNRPIHISRVFLSEDSVHAWATRASLFIFFVSVMFARCTLRFSPR